MIKNGTGYTGNALCVLQTYWGKRNSQAVRTRSGCCTSDPEPPAPEEIQTLSEECSTCSSYKTIKRHFNQINSFKHKLTHIHSQTHTYKTPVNSWHRGTHWKSIADRLRDMRQRQAVRTDPSHWLWLIFQTQHRFITQLNRSTRIYNLKVKYRGVQKSEINCESVEPPPFWILLI